MWGNIFSGAMSLAQGDSPEEILKKQAMTTVMGGAAPAGVDSAGSFAPHLAQTGMEQASSNLAQQGLFGSMGDALGGVGDTIGQGFDYINDKTGMTNKDWTQMGLSQGAQLMQPDPQQPIQAAPMGQGISRPNVDLSKTSGGLLTSNPLLQEKLRQQGLL